MPKFELSCVMMDQLKALCSSSDCSDQHCPARTRLENTLQRYFKFAGFRPGQMDVMLPLMHCKDVCVRMATGSGKSLCMFLPPLAVSNDSMAVIISPLIALMDQQVSFNSLQ